MCMDDENAKSLVDVFDLENLSSDERDEFLEDFGDTVMKSIFRKSWFELDSAKRNILGDLLQESDDDPENVEKHEAVLFFLDEHVHNIRQYAEKEIEQLQNSYRENRDTLSDSQS